MHTFHSEQYLPIPLEQAWEFFANPANLMVLTDSKMKMKMESENGLTPIFTGKVLKITVKLFGLFPSSFLSEMTEVKAPDYFIDTQLTGPFAFWQHKHLLTEIEGGTKITDEVTLKFPLGKETVHSSQNHIFEPHYHFNLKYNVVDFWYFTAQLILDK